VRAFQLDEPAAPKGGFHASISAYSSARISAKTTTDSLPPALSRIARDTLLADLGSAGGIAASVRLATAEGNECEFPNCLALAAVPVSDAGALWILAGLLAIKQEPKPEARSRRCFSLAR
jgi:hypothetical protein